MEEMSAKILSYILLDAELELTYGLADDSEEENVIETKEIVEGK